jgi:hypothetical protein
MHLASEQRERHATHTSFYQRPSGSQAKNSPDRYSWLRLFLWAVCENFLDALLQQGRLGRADSYERANVEDLGQKSSILMKKRT